MSLSRIACINSYDIHMFTHRVWPGRDLGRYGICVRVHVFAVCY